LNAAGRPRGASTGRENSSVRAPMGSRRPNWPVGSKSVVQVWTRPRRDWGYPCPGPSAAVLSALIGPASSGGPKRLENRKAMSPVVWGCRVRPSPSRLDDWAFDLNGADPYGPPAGISLVDRSLDGAWTVALWRLARAIRRTGAPWPKRVCPPRAPQSKPLGGSRPTPSAAPYPMLGRYSDRHDPPPCMALGCEFSPNRKREA
jgi:hypothetical protein